MKIKDIMRNEFISFQADDNLEYIIDTFAKEHITSAPVFDNGEFIGILSDTEIVKYFMPAKFMFLWKKDKFKPIDEIKRVNAAELVKKPNMILKPETELANVLDKIAKKVEFIPVMEDNKLVGIVRGADIIGFFQKELAKGEYKKELIKGVEGAKTATDIDMILDIIRERGEVPCSEISRNTGISVPTVEKLCEVLHKNHLVEMKFSFLRGVVVRRLEHERK